VTIEFTHATRRQYDDVSPPRDVLDETWQHLVHGIIAPSKAGSQVTGWQVEDAPLRRTAYMIGFILRRNMTMEAQRIGDAEGCWLAHYHRAYLPGWRE